MIRGIGLLFCGGLLLSACTPSDDGQALLNQTASEIVPKIVPQLGHQTTVQAVAWVDAGRHLVSLAQDGSLVFWDVAGRAILDHAQVPAKGTQTRGISSLSFQELRPGRIAGTLDIVYYIDVGWGGSDEGICPDTALSDDEEWCTYTLDLETRVVRPDKTVRHSQKYPEPQESYDSRNFPLSPDSKLRPEPNHSDGQRGLLNNFDNHTSFDDSTCKSSDRCRFGVNLFPAGGEGEPIKLIGKPRSYFLDADLSPDGRRLIRIEGFNEDTAARVQTLDLVNGTGDRAFQAGAYHRVSWVGEQSYALFSEGFATDNDTPAAMAGFPPALIVDPACAATGDCRKVESYGLMQALDDDGSFVGVGSFKDCFRMPFYGSYCPSMEDEGGDTSTLPPAHGVSIHAAGSRGWRLIDEAAWNGQSITAMRLSPDRQRLAVATQVEDSNGNPDGQMVVRVWMLDLADGTGSGMPRELVKIVMALAETNHEGGPHFTDRETISDLSFTADGQRVVFTQSADTLAALADLYVVDADGDAEARKFPGFSRNAIAIGNDRVFALDTQALLDIATGQPVARDMGQTRLVRAGWIKRSNLLWGATDDGAIEFWDGKDGSLQLTFYMFPDNRFFAVTPGGRYDTNLGPDTELIRWMVPDAPWQSLGPQTFMRDFYQPGLYRKLLDCRVADNCAEVFQQLPAIAQLNRVTPEVRITEVRPGADAAEAIVSFEVKEGVNPHAANGKTHSGIYNPRLFRNGRVVAMDPDEPDKITDTLERWRELNNVGEDVGDDGWLRYELTIPLPTGPGTEEQLFSAYAFNEDRIKGETASFAYTRPPVAPRKPRAYVVAIGIDDYDTERFKLNYSVADARLIAERLQTIPGYEVRQLVLASERTADGKRQVIDNFTISRVLSLLGINDGREARLQTILDEEGIDASMLEAATPDDIVIISFSGHGWADPQGNFYLVPTNGSWPDGDETPVLSSLYATSNLSLYFQMMNAGDISLIIDACHSSASVASSAFKPGPMGDSGLGQLAYDKGIRILAATQADDVAMEDANLKQGLLTYALAAEGLAPTGGRADLDGDGQIRLNEWLAYAVQRMPSLGQDNRVAQIGRGITFHDLPDDTPKRRVQQPSLFDFNPRESPVILRRIAA